jgi:hypothetical protein
MTSGTVRNEPAFSTRIHAESSVCMRSRRNRAFRRVLWRMSSGTKYSIIPFTRYIVSVAETSGLCCLIRVIERVIPVFTRDGRKLLRVPHVQRANMPEALDPFCLCEVSTLGGIPTSCKYCTNGLASIPFFLLSPLTFSTLSLISLVLLNVIHTMSVANEIYESDTEDASIKPLMDGEVATDAYTVSRRSHTDRYMTDRTGARR